jgi:hypothetical protein
MESTGIREFWEQPTLYLPLRPLCGNDLLEGIYRRSRDEALTGYRYIEANPKNVSDLLIVDIDDENARATALWEHEGFMPNVIVENPANGHAHAVWALSTAIARTEYARRKPLAYASAVTEGLRRSCDGDKAYSGLMTKNPLHESWESELVTDHRYTLDELSEHLTETGDMPKKGFKRTVRGRTVGLGRNVCIFDSARTWAYREVRRHWGDSEGLREAIRSRAHEINLAEFAADPLPYAEVEQIAKSIHKWIVTRSRMWRDGPVVYEATFTLIQSARGKKSGTTRAVQFNQFQEREA